MQEREGILPDFIPDSLVEEGLGFHFSMAHLRPDSIAWKKDAAIAAVEMLAGHAYAILGGDVLELCEGQLDYRDYWDLVDEDVVLWEEYVKFTKDRSIRFMEDTARQRGDSFMYALFFLDERGYKEQKRNFGSIKYR